MVFLLLLLAVSLASAQRTPTISYITQPDIVTNIGGTVEMDCSVLYATEFPVMWVKLPGENPACGSREGDLRTVVSDLCTPVPLSFGSALIVRDNRFR